jgi:hypothetical protein
VPLLERLCQLLKEGEIRLFAYRLCRKALSPFLEYGSAIFFEFDLAAISNHSPALKEILIATETRSGLA